MAQAPGFTDVVLSEIHLLVNTPSTVDVNFEKVGAVQSTVSVSR